LDSLDGWIANRESGFKTLKPGNEAEIVWHNDSISVTDYSIVYLHGFTASKEEGNPVHKAYAKRYGFNMYLPRLYGHGLDTTEPMIDITPEIYMQSAKEALAIGKSIGRKVIIMCCSTGGTLGLYLAAHDPSIEAIICYSPNIDIYNQDSHVATKPWGLQIMRLMLKGDYREYDASDEAKKYWQTRYRIESLITVRSLIDHTMTPETFGLITQPVFVGAYYKDEEHQDDVVSVQAMRDMMPLLGTSSEKKRFVEFDDVGAHVMTNPLRSTNVNHVIEESYNFAEQILDLKPIVSEPRNA